KATIVLGGLLGGLVVGFSIVFLTVNPAQSAGTQLVVAQTAVPPSITAQPVPALEAAPTVNEPLPLPSVRSLNGHRLTGVAKGRQLNGYANGHDLFGHGLSLKQALSKLATAR